MFRVLQDCMEMSTMELHVIPMEGEQGNGGDVAGVRLEDDYAAG